MNNDLISRLSNTWDTLTSSEQQSQLDLLSESITYLKARDNLTGSELTALGGQERWVQRKRIELGSTMEKNSLNQIHADQDMLTQKLHTLESKLHTWSFPTSIMRDVLMKRTQDTIVSYHSFLNAWNNTTPINDKIQLQKEFVETAHHLFHDKLLYGTSIQNELQTVLDSIIMQQWSEWITTELARTTTST